MRTTRRTVDRPAPAQVRAIERAAGQSARGRVAAIDLETSRFFLGEDVIEAAQRGREVLGDPKHEFYFIRIGSRAVDRHRGRIRPR